MRSFPPRPMPKKNGWYQISAGSKKLWLNPTDKGSFRSYESLIKGGPSKTEEGWDGKLYEEAGNLKKFQKAQHTSENEDSEETFDVKILNTKRIGDDLWFEIQIVENRCVGTEKTTQKGWVPAYDAKNKNNLWYYSRGC